MFERISPSFKDRLPQRTMRGKIGVINDLLYSNIHNFNYDTFSFIFELLNENRSLEQAFGALSINSIDLIDRYNGSNCAGLAQKLALELRGKHDIDSVLIPRFGETTPAPLDGEYAGIKTSALLVIDGLGCEYILDPAFAIENAVSIGDEQDNHVDCAVPHATSGGDCLIKLFIPSKKGMREIHFQHTSLENADESTQKNWLRARTRYKICRRTVGGSSDMIDYKFSTNRFAVRLGKIGIWADSLCANEMTDIMAEHAKDIENTFETTEIIGGLERFIARRQEIVSTLLIPELREQILCNN